MPTSLKFTQSHTLKCERLKEHEISEFYKGFIQILPQNKQIITQRFLCPSLIVGHKCFFTKKLLVAIRDGLQLFFGKKAAVAKSFW